MIKTNLTNLTPVEERLKSTIQLISGGWSLKPEIADGKLTVYPWDAEISAWVLSRAERGVEDDTGFSVDIVAKLTRQPAKLIERMLASELMLVMLTARSLCSSGTLEYAAKCPHCSRAQAKSTVNIPGQLGVIGKHDSDYPGYEPFTLPECKDVLSVRPLTVSLARSLTNMKGPLSEAGKRTVAAIISVNDTKPDSIEELLSYYRALPPADTAALTKFLDTINSALDTRIPHRCDYEACGKEFTYNLGLNYDFFL